MGFAVKATFAVDHTKCGGSDSTDFPVLVYASHWSLKDAAHGGLVQSSMGDDILFFSDSVGATQIASEIEFYDNVNGILWAYTKKTVSHAAPDTVFYGFWGNAAPPSRTTNPWDAGYQGVFLFANGTTLSVTDSTGKNTATNYNATAVAGQVDGAAGFAQASAQYIDLGNAAAIEIVADLTLECWVKYTGAFTNGAYREIISNLSGSSPSYNGYQLQLNAHNDGYPDKLEFQCVKASTFSIAVANAAFALNAVHHVVATYNNTTGAGILYIDGVAQTITFTVAAGLGASAQNVNAGRWPASPGVSYWDGYIDNLRISNVTRSADYATTCFNNQNSPGTFLSTQIDILQRIPSMRQAWGHF